jgi:hypothetical protein
MKSSSGVTLKIWGVENSGLDEFLSGLKGNLETYQRYFKIDEPLELYTLKRII